VQAYACDSVIVGNLLGRMAESWISFVIFGGPGGLAHPDHILSSTRCRIAALPHKNVEGYRLGGANNFEKPEAQNLVMIFNNNMKFTILGNKNYFFGIL
jgi:hypothetical protein